MKIESSNKLQLHYYFSDNSHGFDAIVRNDCKKEILQIFGSTTISVDIDLILQKRTVLHF